MNFFLISVVNTTKIVPGNFWFVHLQLRDEPDTWVQLIMFLPRYTVMPVTRMNYVVRH